MKIVQLPSVSQMSCREGVIKKPKVETILMKDILKKPIVLRVISRLKLIGQRIQNKMRLKSINMPSAKQLIESKNLSSSTELFGSFISPTVNNG